MIVVAAVDRSKEAKQIVAEAATIAESLDVPLHLAHVISRSEFTELGKKGSRDGQSADLDEIRETAAGFAHKGAEGINVPYEAVGLIGKPAEEIKKYADRKNAKYIVIGGRKRSPTGKALFGSVSQQILLNSTCPVISVMSSK